MSDSKFSKISSILFSDEVINFGVYRSQGTFFSALIRNMTLLLYISHILINNTFTFVVVFNTGIFLSVLFVYGVLMGIIISAIHIFFFLIAIFQDYSALNFFPVLGRKRTTTLKKILIGFAYILSYLLCVDSFVSWLFMINLKFEEKEHISEKVYEAAPCISMMQENLHNAAVNDEMSNTV